MHAMHYVQFQGILLSAVARRLLPRHFEAVVEGDFLEGLAPPTLTEVLET